MNSSLKKYTVEFIGTFFFLSVIMLIKNPLAIGAALTAVVFLGGAISGGNFNPAVTIMMAAANKLAMSDVLPYITAQIAGGLCALLVYKQVI